MKYNSSILNTIGNTPLVKLNRITKNYKPQIFAKLESHNPGGSVKDRIGLAMIEDAERKGLLKPGGTVIEATSGNTGIGLAIASAVKGYKSIFVVTEKVSSEKINYLKALGADVIVVSNLVKPDSPEYYINVAQKINKEIPNSIFMYQYSNPANPEIHYLTTGPEIWEQTEGKITHFVSGIGTGGTISGVGKFLKEKKQTIQIIGADPLGSIFKAFKETGNIISGTPYLVEGIGQDYIPENVKFEYIDHILNISDQESFEHARILSREEGIFCGGSTGTILAAALKVAAALGKDDLIVFIVCDTGERYLSKFHSDEWLRENDLLHAKIKTLKDIIDLKKRENRKTLVFLYPTDKVIKAFELINTTGFSQLPVIDHGESIGSVTEAKLMKVLVKDRKLFDKTISEIMEPGFPVLDQRTELEMVRKYLSDFQAVLVSEYGRIINIVTSYDILQYSKIS